MSMSAELRNYRGEGFLCDVLLQTSDGGEAWAHSPLLAAASPVFRAAMQENSSKHVSRYIHVSGMDKVSIVPVLDYIYTGCWSVPGELRGHREGLVSLLACVQTLGIDCTQFLQARIQDTMSVFFYAVEIFYKFNFLTIFNSLQVQYSDNFILKSM